MFAPVGLAIDSQNNLFVALNFGVVAWSAFMSVYGILSKLGLLVVQYVTMRAIMARRSGPAAA